MPVELPFAVLGSSHAPEAGTVVAEQLRRYSAAWHRWDPANSAAHSACIFGRLPAPPLVLWVVKPANRTLSGVLQQASTRLDVQSPLLDMEPVGVTQVPLYAEVPSDQELQVE